MEPGSPGPRKVAAGIVALALFTGAAVFSWRTFVPDGTRQQQPSLAPGPGGALDELPVGWTQLPAPPEVRSGAATAWTGRELLVWGGFKGFDERAVSAEGLAFDATFRTWSAMPLGPLQARALAASAWTGTELLVWGGWSGMSGPEFVDGFYDDGAAFDPASGTWRRLPSAPITARAPLSVWTGRELLVWGTALRMEDRPRDGAAYDPANDTWRVIPEAPIELTDASAVWTGEEMVVFGAALHGGNSPESETAIGAAYDPTADSWRRITDSTLSPQASTASWNGSEMIAWDYLNHSAAYDPVADSWRPLPRVPLDDSECSPRSAAAGAYVLGHYCGALAMFDPLTDRWRGLQGPERSAPPFWSFELIPASSAFLLPAQRYGETHETRFFAFRPGSPAEVEATPAAATPFIPQGSIEGGISYVPVTFPDGSSTTLTYPTELNLASLGLQPDVSYIWRGDTSSRHPIVFVHGPAGVERAYVEGDHPTAGFPLPGGGEAALWPARRAESHRLSGVSWWLVYRTESWSALASLRHEDDAEALASALAIYEAETGLPFVMTTGPVYLAEFAGEDEGPDLAFGDAIPDPSIVSDLDPLVLLSPQPCMGGPEFDSPPTYASNCLAGGNVFVGTYGEDRFIRAVLDGLRADSFSQPQMEDST
jgi:hypothetical protein